MPSWRGPPGRWLGSAPSTPRARYATLLRDGASDVVFLGTGGSSLGGQTLAQLAGYAVPGVRALRPSQQVRAKRGPMTRLRECRNP